MAVNLFTGATDNNWGTATNWSQGTVPTAVDGHTVTFDATSPNCTVNGSDRVFMYIDFTGYTNTITMTFNLELRNNSVIFDSGMNVTGSGKFIVNYNGGVTITSNGFQWPNDFEYNGNGGTFTLADNLVILGTYRHTNGSGGHTLSTGIYSLSCNGLSTTSENINGTGSKIILTGGTWSGSGGSIQPNLDLQGNITVSGNVSYRDGTLTYISGTITTTGSVLNITGSGTTTVLNTNGVTWGSLQFVTSGTVTLTSNFTATGAIYIAFNNTPTLNGAFTCSGNGLNLSGTASINGTTKLILTGGTWTHNAASGIVYTDLDLQGNVTVSGTVYYSSRTLKYVSGTITVTGSTLGLLACTLDTAGMTWRVIDFQTPGASGSYTIASNCVMSGTCTITGRGAIINGSAYTITANGLSITNLNSSTISGTISKYILTGGTWSCGNNGIRTLQGNIEFAGNVTLGGSYGLGFIGTMTYVSGVVTASQQVVVLGTSTFNTAGVTFSSILLQGGNISISLPTDLTTAQLLCNSGTITWGVGNAYVTSLLSLTGTAIFQGSTLMRLNGATWSGAGSLRLNTWFESGTCTVSGAVFYQSGTITYIAGSVTTTSSTLTITGSCTLNTVGMNWNNITVSLVSTVTLSSNTNCARFASTTNQACTLTGAFFLYCSNGVSAGETITSSTTTIEITGGTWTCGSNRNIQTDLRFNGNSTISGQVGFANRTMTWVSGTITTTGSELFVRGNCTLNTEGMFWNNIQWGPNANITVTLTSNWDINGVVTFAGGTSNIINTTTGKLMNCYGGFTTGSSTVVGTATLYLRGGSWTAGGTGIVSIPLTINGNPTISGVVYYGGNGILTYEAGTPVVTGSTLTLTSCTLDTVGMSWNTVATSATTAQIYTINSLLSAATLNLGLATTQNFTGTAGFEVTTLSCAAISVQTINFKESITYTVTDTFSCYQARVGSIPLFTSAHASLRANILLPNNGSTVCNVLASFTRIDASGGRTINSFGGTISDCVNVRQFYDYQIVGI